ncbi:MAG: PAS domain S-box protein [Caldilineaceae bacterium]|nr:PAS domain S-box protein [Caldilineaceae bacterium]
MGQHLAALQAQVRALQDELTPLQHREALYRTTFDQAPVGIAHVAPDGRWLRVNQHLCHILGYTREELLQLSFQDITYPEDLMIDLDHAAQMLAGEISTYTMQKRYLHKQWGLIWASLTASLVRDEGGTPAYFISVIEDITQLKEAELALEQSEERYRRVVEDQTDLICRFTPDFKLTFVNRPYSKAFGKRPPDLLGQPIADVILPEYQAPVYAHLSTLNPDNRTGIYENPIRSADGALHWFQWTNQVIVDAHNQVIEYQSVGRDITERKHAEDAEREQRRYAEALRDSLAMLTSSLDVENVLKQILTLAATVVPSEAGSILLFENAYGRVAYWRGFAPAAEEFWNHYRFSLDSPLFKHVLDTHQPYWVPDTHVAPEWVPLPIIAWIRSSIGIPIELRGKIIGMLIANSATPHHFQPADIEKLQVFARYASLALENADHVAHLERRVAERTAELRFYASLQEQVSDAVITMDLDCWIQSWNRAAEVVYGWRAEEAIGKQLTNLLQTDYGPSMTYEQAKHALLEQGSWHGEIAQQHKNGTRLHIASALTVLHDEVGVPYGVVIINRDVTKRKQAEEALQSYAAEVKALYNEAPCGYHSIDAEGCFVQMNDTELQWLGYHRAEVIGRLKMTDILTPASQAAFQTVFAHLKEQGWVKDAEFELSCKDGTQMTILLSSRALYDANGRFLESRATSYDITELKQAQQAIRENEEKFRLLVEVAPLAILISDHQGKITLMNDQAEQLFGYTKAELIGQSVDILVPEAVRGHHPALRSNYMARPGVRRMASDRSLFAVRKDGSEFPVEIQLSFTEHQVGSFIMDITERKQAAEALRVQRDFLQMVIDSVPNLIWVKDRAGYFKLVNAPTAQIYRMTPMAVVGQRGVDLQPTADIPRFHEQELTTLASGEPLFIPETMIDGRCYQANLIPLQNSNEGYDRVLLVASDITTRKQAEETLQHAFQTERELSELKSRFVSMASHEFRTPLTTISSLAETLRAYRHKLSDEQITRRLEKIQDQVHYLNDIIEDVLQLAQIQARRSEFNPVALDFDGLCRNVMEEFQAQETVLHDLRYICEPIPPLLKLDKRLMRQIINNLLANAIKYSPQAGAVFVNVTYTAAGLVFQVRDEGIGIPEADLKHLFEPFHRASNVGTISGTGLGLAIAKESVERHGGTISVASQAGIGTTFTVRIPPMLSVEKDI